jgi:glycine/serine hydroxymethyltransferase
MGEAEMRRIAEFIHDVLRSGDDATVARVARGVRDLAAEFPLYPDAVRV